MTQRQKQNKAIGEFEKYSHSNGNKVVTMEDIELGKKYAITVCPSDALQYWTSKEDRLKLFIKHWTKLFSMLSCDIEIWCEITGCGRLHWHGTIKFVHDIGMARFYVEQIKQILLDRAIVEIDTIKDLEIWGEYCRKQYNKFKLGYYKTNVRNLSLLLTTPIYKKIPLDTTASPSDDGSALSDTKYN